MTHDAPAAEVAGPIAPTRDDPLVAGGAEVLGGPVGVRARPARRFWTPIRILLVLGTLTYALGALSKFPCVANGWVDPDRYEHLCYTDISPLYSLRGFAAGLFPYLEQLPGQEVLEYPVLTGVFMWVAAWITRLFGAPSGEIFYHVNVVMLLAGLLATVAGTALTVRRRPWDAAMVALAPSVFLAATINWDLLAIGLSSLAIAAWARQRNGWAGLLLGLAIAAKFYPLVLLGPWFLLALRAGRMRQFATLLGTAAASWLVVNAPFIIGNFDGWSRFYVFSAERGQDFGSIWMALDTLGIRIEADSLNFYATGSFLVLCVGISWVCLAAPRRPRLASVLFLVVAAFCVTNKVYSPQYVLWMVPLAVLARPRWREFLVWQAFEAVYFVAIWWYLVGFTDGAKGLTVQWYSVAIAVHILGTLWYAALVIRDVWRPERDPVRSDGLAEHRDDPGGGCLDRAPDAWSLARREALDEPDALTGVATSAG